jgi:DNA-binding NtrC family response regulator
VNTVLVVEPRRYHRLLLQEELEYEGYLALPVATVAEARLELIREAVDLAILDVGHASAIRMDLFGLLYQLHSRLPVIVYTGYEPEDNGPIVRLATAYVVKTSDLGPLMDAVHRLLPNRRAARQSPFLQQVPEALLCGAPVG